MKWHDKIVDKLYRSLCKMRSNRCHRLARDIMTMDRDYNKDPCIRQYLEEARDALYCASDSFTRESNKSNER